MAGSALAMLSSASIAALAVAPAGAVLAFRSLPVCVDVLLARVASRGGSCEGGVSRSSRMACSLAFGAVCGWTAGAWCAAEPGQSMLVAVGAACRLALWAALLLAVACDLAARVIPRETCWIVGGAGTVLQLAVGGVGEVASGAAFGAACAALCALANRIAEGHGGDRMVGGGDIRCMAALSLTSGSHAFVGFAVCFGVAAAVALVGVAARRMSGKTALPLAPFFCLWAAFGAGGILP